ncbi:MAG: acetylornithine transaminase [Dehalococcoidia bacterium]|nr:MAG: acetylornithine transaminase [Dehalococcoidia bacterium]
MTDWKELESKYFMHTFERVPVVLVRGQGTRVWDENSREYLDLVSGWAVNSLGHCHPVVVEAVKEQVGTLIQTSNQFYTIPQLKLAELLVKSSGLDKVFLCNSGAEANEGAAKLARRYGERKLGSAYKIITALGSFHGRTLAMVAATGQAKHQQPYVPLPDGFVNVAYDNIAAIKAATTKETCAVMVEPLQGEGGVNVPGEDYLKEVRAWCDENGILMILDEVQTGIGRLGSLFACQQACVVPDVMTLAKGLASGIPIGAILAREEAAVFQPGEHGSTFGGNPVTCAAAYATVKYIVDNKLSDKAARTGKYFTEGLEKLKNKYSFIREIRGRGLLLAMEFDREIAQAALNACLEKGLLVNRVKPSVLRFMPPLIITREEVDEAVGILDRVLAEMNL